MSIWTLAYPFNPAVQKGGETDNNTYNSGLVFEDIIDERMIIHYTKNHESSKHPFFGL